MQTNPAGILPATPQMLTCHPHYNEIKLKQLN